MSPEEVPHRVVPWRLAVQYGFRPGRPDRLLYDSRRRDKSESRSRTADVGSWRRLEQSIEDVRKEVRALTRLAEEGRPRGDAGVEDAAEALRHLALPADGLAGLTGSHLELDTSSDPAASEIPWEVLEEDGEKVVLARHLTHFIRPRASGTPPSAGRGFLLVLDPRGDLLHDDPDGICRRHVDALPLLLEQLGYRVRIHSHSNATRGRILRALADPEISGIYLFCHGTHPEDESEGFLVLHDGVLHAGEIEEIAPSARFVYVNACHAARDDPDRAPDQWDRGIGSAFASAGRERTVIAPIFPVVNTQAARAALTFFTHAVEGEALEPALRRARQESLRAYRNGHPDTAWMAYRYHGDLEATLPSPAGVDIHSQYFLVSRGPGEKGCGPEQFAFAMEEVVLEADRRRNQTGRHLLSGMDLACGLLLRADLTRHLIRTSSSLDPDTVAQRLWRAPEVRTPERRREGAIRWVVAPTHRVDADVAAALAISVQSTWSGEGLIQEGALLEALLSSGAWPDAPATGLPGPEVLLRTLREVEAEGLLDRNGWLSLDGLTPAARRVVETALSLAQQRGMDGIRHHIFLVSLLEDARGHAARAVESLGLSVRDLRLRLLEAKPSRPPRGFGLSPEVCERIVSPVLDDARAHASDEGRATDADLFQAFCRQARKRFRQFLRRLHPQLDLERMDVEHP